MKVWPVPPEVAAVMKRLCPKCGQADDWGHDIMVPLAERLCNDR